MAYDILDGFLCCHHADLRIGTCTESSCEFLSDLNLGVCVASGESLIICIYCNVIDSSELGFYHLVNSIASAAADSDYFDNSPFFIIGVKL